MVATQAQALGNASRSKRRAWSFVWPPLALLISYATLWFYSVIISGFGGYSGNVSHCWGRVMAPHGQGWPYPSCVAAWGWWSPLLYLPVLLIAAVIATALVTRSWRVMRIGSLAALASLIVSVGLLLGTHGVAAGQMPLIWPS
jgi:hypothetical protein